ncbi:radical SAM family heme chaperone HemW [Desulfobacterales bacterium HSG17]|nr:radical SAM family heme chaperone HemW [Desulfobacterales bacterium HSG17]
MSVSSCNTSCDVLFDTLFNRGAIYLHIPFCIQKCIYCDFYSKTDLFLIPDYIKALEAEIRKRSVKQYKINTIYFGGGTPSLLSVKEVDLLLQTIKDCFAVLPDAEISFEINPCTVDFNYLESLRNIGVNRLSIGLQSFNDDKLEFLKRIHKADQAVKAIENAKKAGFSNISLDLIYGLPFETGAVWLQDLEQAVRMKPEHLSCYMLTIEPLTPLDNIVKQGLVHPLDNQSMASLFKETAHVLNEFQFEHYEISSFAKGRAYRSKHNSQYWDMTPYFGFGAAAHSYDGNKRSWNHRSIKNYIKDINSGRLPVEDFETLTLEQKKLETIMLGLRTLEGVDMKQYKSQFHISFQEEFSENIEAVQGQSYGLLGADSFVLNLEGQVCLDDIIESFARHIVT